MTDRHLLPEEIDQLLDDESEVAAPLKTHLSTCANCRGRLDDARAITDLIEQLPRHVPSHKFSERVMADVPVFEPWHVAAQDSLARWTPAAGRSRNIAMAAGFGIALVLAILSVGLATQTDLVVFAGDVVVDRVREWTVAGFGGLVAGLFGEATFNAVAQHGPAGFALAGGALLVGMGGTFATLRALAASASRRRG